MIAETALAAPLPAAKLAPARIVLVEDSDEVRHSLTFLLRTRGFSVDAYRTGIELLSSKFLPEADCFLIDYKMPSINGVQLLAKLRAGGVTSPALLLTGFLSTYLKEAALKVGFVDVMEKPPMQAELVNRLSSITRPV